MEIKRSGTKFVYRIEPKPDGGYIAKPEDPSFETIEGTSIEDLEKKISAKLSTMSLTQLSSLPGATFVPGAISAESAPLPIAPSSADDATKWKIVSVVLVILLILTLIYFLRLH